MFNEDDPLPNVEVEPSPITPRCVHSPPSRSFSPTGAATSTTSPPVDVLFSASLNTPAVVSPSVTVTSPNMDTASPSRGAVPRETQCQSNSPGVDKSSSKEPQSSLSLFVTAPPASNETRGAVDVQRESPSSGSAGHQLTSPTFLSNDGRGSVGTFFSSSTLSNRRSRVPEGELQGHTKFGKRYEKKKRRKTYSLSENTTPAAKKNYIRARAKARKRHKGRSNMGSHSSETTPSHDDLGMIAVQTLYNAHPLKVETCLQLLGDQLKKLGRIYLHNTPLKQFSTEQVYLVAKEVYNKLDRQMIRSSDILNLFGNLVLLQNNSLLDACPASALHYASVLQNVITIISEVSNLLEKYSKLPVTDWISIAHLNKSAAAGEFDKYHRMESIKYYIPKLSDFELPQKIASGQYGNVYKAMYAPTRSILALKVVPLTIYEYDASGVARCPAYEDKVAASILNDSTILKVFCCFLVKPHTQVIVMDYDHRSIELRKVVEAEKFLSTDCVGFIILQVMLALEHIHLRGLIYRDLNCSNVLLDETGHLKIIDFDKTKVCMGHFSLQSVSWYFRRTKAEFNDGHKVCELYYTAPEVLKNGRYGRACDWWSLGILLYKVSTGQVPFRASDVVSTKEKIIKANFGWPFEGHSASIEAKEICFDLLNKQPTRRLGSNSYGDLKRHAYITKYINKLDAVRGEVQKRVNINGRDTDITKRMLFYSTNLVKLRAIFRRLRGTNARREVSQEFYSLEDAETDEQFPLLTFASKKFRKLKDRIEAAGWSRMSSRSTYLKELTPPALDMDYGEVEILSSGTVSSPGGSRWQRHTSKNMLDATIPLGKSIFRRNKTIQVVLALVTAEDNRTFPVIRSIFPFLGRKRDTVIDGDIVVSIMQTPVIQKPLASLEILIEWLIQENKDLSALPCQVLAHNTFRLLDPDSFLVPKFKNLVQCELTLLRPNTTDEYLRVAAQVVQNKKSAKLTVYNIITFVHSQLRVEGPEKLLFGDVLHSINGCPCSSISYDIIKSLLKFSESKIVIEILALSVLRRLDLMETATSSSP